MISKKKTPEPPLLRASGPGVFNETYIKCYHTHPAQSSPKLPDTTERAEKIAERRAQMPRSYKATYDKAVKGKSLRAAINAFCLECVCWQRKEVTLCTDLACPLYAVRPYQLPQKGREGRVSSAESIKSRIKGK